VKFNSDRYSDIELVESTDLLQKYTANDSVGRNLQIVALSEGRARNPQIVDHFKHQAELLGSMDDSEFVRLIEYLEPDGNNVQYAAVMEAMPYTLAAIAGRSELHPKTVVNILNRILEAVDSLHSEGYLHLGITSDDVGVNQSCSEIKLSGIGSCYRVENAASAINIENPKYGAPELYGELQENDSGDGTTLGQHSDIYSIGLLGYELLVGSKNFHRVFKQVLNEKSDELRNKKWINWHRNSETVPLAHELNTDVSEPLSIAISRMMEKNPRRRLGNGAECKRALSSSSAVKGRAENGPSTQKEEKKSTPAWLYVLGVAGCVGTIALAYFMFLKPEPAPAPVPLVSQDEFLNLAARNKDLREQISNLKFETDAVYEDALSQLDLAREKEDLDVQYEHLQLSTAGFQSYFDGQISDRHKQLEEELMQLSSVAEVKGTMNLQPINFEEYKVSQDNPAEAGDVVTLMENMTAEYRKGISVNARKVIVGSSDSQINSALEACRRYVQGCALEWYADELQREVILEPYELDSKEVTVSQFAEYVDKYSVVTEAERRGFSTKVVVSEGFAVAKVNELSWKTAYEDSGQTLPVVHVTRADASGYCESVDKRLPTEDEWEFSARGPSLNVYPWGMEWDKGRLYWGETKADTILPVGSFTSTDSGLFDLAGSVSEWTSTNGSQPGHAMLKGGSRFDTNVANIRLAVRRSEPVDYSGEDVGFRCAKDLETWLDQEIK